MTARAVGRRTAKKKTGRNLLPINPRVVEAMASVGATNAEIAKFLRCHVDTITNRFSELLDKSRAGQKIKLRRLQWRAAERGDRTMLVWLGKQYLDQSEKVDTRTRNLTLEELIREAASGDSAPAE